MAAKIHHATRARATKLGLRMDVVEGEVVVYKGDEVVSTHLMGNKALEVAEAKLGIKAGDKPAKAPKPAKAAKTPKPPKAPKSEGEESEDDEDDKPSKSIVRVKYKKEYKARGGHNGDELAEMMDNYCKEGKGKKRRVNVAAVKEVAEQNGVWQPSYADMNPGQARMNVGNRLRGLLKKGTPVKVGRQTIQPESKE